MMPTEPSDDRGGVTKNGAKSIGERIRCIIDVLTALLGTTHQCYLSFDWLVGNDARPIFLLDFDIVCGALPRFALQELSVENLEGDGPRSPVVAIGPRAIRNMLSNIGEFTLPPGALIEIHKKERELAGEASIHQRNLLSKIDQCLRERNPGPLLAQGEDGTQLLKAVRTEIETYFSYVTDHQLFKLVVQRQEPIEELLRESEGNASSEKAFNDTLALLEVRRRGRDWPNFADALNVACTVKLLNRRPNAGRRLPILLSRSRWITEMIGRSRVWFDDFDAREMQLFNDHIFLVIANGVIGRYGLRPVDSHTCLLLNADLGRLHGAYKDFLRQLEDAGHTHVTSLDDIDARSKLAWERIRDLQTEFRNAWSWLLEPAAEAARLDHVEMANRLLTDDLQKLLGSNSAASAVAAAAQIRAKLVEGGSGLNELIESPLPPLTIRDRKPILRRSPDDGTPLRRLGGTEQDSSPDDDARYRVSVHVPDYLPDLYSHAVMTVSEPGADGRNQVLWRHAEAADRMWSEGLHYLPQLVNGHAPRGGEIEISCFGVDGPTRERAHLERAEGRLRELFRTLKPRYVELRFGEVVYLFDVRAPQAEELEAETQAGLLLPVSLWSEPVRRMSATLIADTSTLHLGPKIVRSWMEEALALVLPGTER